jgi:exopolysaccharide biosynthesis predicted pyruvyltransferase EpsI
LDLTLAERTMRLAVKYILGFRRIHTDRLHCAILSGILGRETVLYPNSYYKNGAVFAHSLSRISNVRFDGECAVQADANCDPVAFLISSERLAQ